MRTLTFKHVALGEQQKKLGKPAGRPDTKPSQSGRSGNRTCMCFCSSPMSCSHPAPQPCEVRRARVSGVQRSADGRSGRGAVVLMTERNAERAFLYRSSRPPLPTCVAQCASRARTLKEPYFAAALMQMHTLGVEAGPFSSSCPEERLHGLSTSHRPL